MTTYSNGWGHLIVTLAVLSMSTALLILHVVDPTSIMGMVGTVTAFWFLSGSSKFQQPPEPTPPTKVPVSLAVTPTVVTTPPAAQPIEGQVLP